MLRKNEPDKAPIAAGSVTAEDYLHKLSPEEQARFRAFEEQTKKVRELANSDPEAMSQLLQIWLAQGRRERDEDATDPVDKAP